MRARWLGSAVAIALLGCGGSAAMRAAKDGNLVALHDAIAAREKADDLSAGQAADLAKVVASRELETAKKPEDAKERVRDVRACAHELDDALAQRMKTRDAAGAEAALARIETGELDVGDARPNAGDPDAAWRAVGMRAMTRPEDSPTRRRGMADTSPLVRRQAMHAARIAGDAADLLPLASAARLDPEPLVRTGAVRAIARLPPNAEVANRLRDLWVGADDALREDIAAAWAEPNVFRLGGREALRVLIAANHGPGVIEAAAAIVRQWPGDAELLSLATGHILDAIASGTKRERLHAIAVARLDDSKDTREAIVKASADSDQDVRMGALSRMLELPQQRAETIKTLEQIAGHKEDPLSSRARFALAGAGDRKVQLWIERDLTAKDPYDRLAAASALAALGVSSRGAPLLADADAQVRTRAACTLLMAARIHK